MNQHSTEPEYTVQESEKTLLTVNKPDCLNRNYFAVVADLVQLEQQLILQADISEKILGSLHVLVQSLVEQQ